MLHFKLPMFVLMCFGIGVPVLLLCFVVPLWFVCRKAGFSPWLTLLNCVPFGTPALLYLLAFAEWRKERKYERTGGTIQLVGR